MPKRGFAKEHSSREEKELRQAAKYHWEFKRRNPGYRSWWQQGLRETTKPEGWDERFNPDLSFEEVIKSSVPRAIEEFLAIIGDSPLRETFVKPPGLQAAFEHRLMRNLVLQGVKEDMGRGPLTIEIDFTKIRSVPALREYISGVIEIYYKIFITPSILPDSAREKLGRSRKLGRDFETILRAGDMAAEGKTFAQIAGKLYPGDANPEAARTKAYQWVQRYEEFVNGGYKDITYP